MKIKLLSITGLIIVLSSCNRPDCTVNNLRGSGWSSLDSNVRYKICSNSGIKLKEGDSIEIQYLGIFKNNENILVQSPIDTFLFTIATQISFGKIRNSNAEIPPSLKKLIPLLPKNSEAVLEFDLSSQSPVLETDKKITVWFKGDPDSSRIFSSIAKYLVAAQYDSIKYISKEKAVEKWGLDQLDQNDSTWLTFLDKNPLPVSLEIYMKKAYFSFPFLDTLKVKIMASEIVSDVSYPSKKSIADTNELNKLMKNKFYIRLKT